MVVVSGCEFLTYGGEIGENDKPIYLSLKPASTGGRRDPTFKTVEIPVFAFNNIEFIKDKLRTRVHAFKTVKSNKIMLSYKGIEIKQGKLVNDYNFEGTRQQPAVIEYTLVSSVYEQEGGAIELLPDEMVLCTTRMENRIADGQIALKSGLVPRLASDGTGGTYFIPHPMGRGYAPIACFKPKDEEPCGPNNPRGFQGKENSDGFRPGIYSTQGAYREVCAFLLDHASFAGVPDTALVHARHESYSNPGKIIWKIGSYQEFVDAEETAGNFHPREYSTEDTHRIGIFDVRVVNMDRNDGNILVKPRSKKRRADSKYQLVPIDHGLILPDRLEIIEEDIVWMSWPQTKLPFSKTCVDFIADLNYEKEARDAEKYLGIRRDPLRLMKCATILLQIAACHGLTLYDIGQIMYRQDLDEPSILQDMLTLSLDAALLYGGVRQSKRAVKESTWNTSSLLSGLNLETSRMAGRNTKMLPSPIRQQPETACTTPNNQATWNKKTLSDGSDGCVSSSIEVDAQNSDTKDNRKHYFDERDKAQVGSDGSTAATPEMIPALIPPELHDLHQGADAALDNMLQETEDDIENSIPYGGVGTAIRMNPPEASMSIFSRPDKHGKETVLWTPDLESVFLEHVKEAIGSHIKIRQARNAENPVYGKVVVH